MAISAFVKFNLDVRILLSGIISLVVIAHAIKATNNELNKIFLCNNLSFG